MKITTAMMEQIEALSDDDARQDLYVKLLEWVDQPTCEAAFIQTMYNNILKDRRRTESRRREIEQDHKEEFMPNGDDDSHDPMEYIEGEALVGRLEKLSPLLYNTLCLVQVERKSIKEVAEQHGVSEAVIHTRIHRAKELIS